MAVLDKEVKIIMLKGAKGTDGTDGTDGKSSYQLAVENELFSGTLAEWINTFATPENYITRAEFQKVTQAQYDALKLAGELIPNCYYLIIDDTSAEDFEQALEDISTLDNDINNQTTGLKTKVLNIQNYLNNANLNLNEILSLINNTTSDKSNWIFTPKYSYHNFEVGTDTDDVLEAVIKQLCIDYPNKENITFFGTIEPNSTGIYFLHIYNTSDLTNGLPRYSMGLYVGKDIISNFGTWEYSFLYVNIEEKISTLENKHLYKHDIKLVYPNSYLVYFTFYTNSATAMTTIDEIMQYMASDVISASGSVKSGSDWYVITSLYKDANKLYATYMSYTNNQWIENSQLIYSVGITDSVIQVF